MNLAVLQMHMSNMPRQGVAFSLGALIGDGLLIITNNLIIGAISEFIPTSSIRSVSAALLIVYALFVIYSTLFCSKRERPVAVRSKLFIGYTMLGVGITYFSPVGVPLWATLVASTQGDTAIWLAIASMTLGSLTWFVLFNSTLLISAQFFTATARKRVTLASAAMMCTLGAISIV